MRALKISLSYRGVTHYIRRCDDCPLPVGLSEPHVPPEPAAGHRVAIQGQQGLSICAADLAYERAVDGSCAFVIMVRATAIEDGTL